MVNVCKKVIDPTVYCLMGAIAGAAGGVPAVVGFPLGIFACLLTKEYMMEYMADKRRRHDHP